MIHILNNEVREIIDISLNGIDEIKGQGYLINLPLAGGVKMKQKQIDFDDPEIQEIWKVIKEILQNVFGNTDKPEKERNKLHE